MFSPSNREILVVLLLFKRGCNSHITSKILLYLPVDVALLGEPRKFLCVSFLIYPIILAFNLVGFACQYPNSGIRAFLVGVVNTQKLFVYTVTIHVYGAIHLYGTIHPYGTVHLRYCWRI